MQAESKFIYFTSKNTNISLLEGQPWTCIIVGDLITNNYTPTAEQPVINITWFVNAASLWLFDWRPCFIQHIIQRAILPHRWAVKRLICRLH